MGPRVCSKEGGAVCSGWPGSEATFSKVGRGGEGSIDRGVTGGPERQSEPKKGKVKNKNGPVVKRVKHFLTKRLKLLSLPPPTPAHSPRSQDLSRHPASKGTRPSSAEACRPLLQPLGRCPFGYGLLLQLAWVVCGCPYLLTAAATSDCPPLWCGSFPSCPYGPTKAQLCTSWGLGLPPPCIGP